MSRIHHAALDPNAVIDTDGLLAAFNDTGVLDALDVLAAQRVGQLLGESDQRVVLAAALAVRGTRFGHVCIRLDTVREAVAVDRIGAAQVDDLPWPEPEEWTAAVAGSVLVGDGRGDQPLVLAGGRLYLERYYRYELTVASLLLERCGGSPADVTPAAGAVLDRLLLPDDHGSPSRQHQAAVRAMSNRLAVIAGGPGTGKTYAVGVMLAALAAGDGDFPLTAVCAPTGKAAARLGEALRDLAARVDDPAVTATLETVAPSTIHRLLGWTWGRAQFAHDAGNPLPHDLVVVDEMSMVSLPMAAKLLSAVRRDATVVLVGDPFQLESIEAGTVLADIVGPAVSPGVAPVDAPIAAHVTVLDRVHRFEESGVIADFADSVRTGDADAALALLGPGYDELRWIPDRETAEFDRLWSTLTDQRSRMVRLARSGEAAATLAALNEIAVLCAHRRGPGGVSRWSRDLEADLDERFHGLRWGGEWYPGRPLMVTANDYEMDLYNGDIGVCIDTDDGPRAVFERGGVREVALSRIGQHTTVHAMTIHKSQGSQFDAVAVVLPDDASRLLTRELLYTAVTRAASTVTVVGEESVVRGAIERSVQRASGLGTRLWG